MDIKWKKYSHSIITKIIVFIIVIGCFTGTVAIFVNNFEYHEGRLGIVFEESYFKGNEYRLESEEVLSSLVNLIKRYKSKENILNSGSIDKRDIEYQEEELYSEFEFNSKYFNSNLSREENYKKFKETYNYELAQIKEDLIQKDLEQYNTILKVLEYYKGFIYYASDGEIEITNSLKNTKDYFRTFSSYMIFDEDENVVYPKEIKYREGYSGLNPYINIKDRSGISIYIANSDDFLNSNIKEWKENKVRITNSLYALTIMIIGFLLSFIYLVSIIGRKSFKDKELHLNLIDRIYGDINLALCFGLITLWVLLASFFFDSGNTNVYKTMIPITASIAILGFILILALIKNFKNKTLLKHTLIYTLSYTFFNKIFKFIKDTYDSGSIGVKVVLIAIGYPVLVALTFFMFPITIGVAAWLALKKVKEFNAIKEGVERIKNGDIHYSIETTGNGELVRLATNINGIGAGLKEAVNNELKSERLKTELITNVSHDIRTPLTSIITYVDLLKQEKDKSRFEGYIEVLEQKSQRLKVLTDDLFQAAKASSGSIPVNLDKIDIVSLITQGLGELNDEIEVSQLEFKMNYAKDKVYITADGKLLWRAIENLLSNIFKYALKSSRVYIDIEDLNNEVSVTIKNISAYELNISADELMERFKRGDESRTSQGSGLGLSIAKSLIDVQNGTFNIEVDGDLFKAIIKMPEYKN